MVGIDTPNDPPASAPARARLLSTSAGSITDAFGPTEWGLLSAVAVIWGSSFLFISIGLEAFTPGVVALARVGLGAATLALVPRARKPIAREDLPSVALLGVVWMGLPLILFPVAQQWIDSSLAGMLNGAVPLASAAWAVVLLRRMPGSRQLAGLAVGFLGVVAVSWPSVRDADATALGTALVLLAVFLYGLSTNLAVPLQQRYGALPVLLRVQLFAVVIVLPYALFDLRGSSFAWGPALAMLPLGILGTAVAFVLMATLVGRVGAPRGSVAIYFVPVVAIVLGVLVRGESVAPIALVGTGLVLIGAWLTSRREQPRVGHAPRRPRS